MKDETASQLQGGCHCGAVRYRLSQAPDFTFLCHCRNCQKLNGSMRLAGATLPLEALDIQGELRGYAYRGGKGDIVSYFCPACGTHVYATPKAYGDVAVVRAGTLDEPERFTPKKSIFTDTAYAWETLIGK